MEKVDIRLTSHKSDGHLVLQAIVDDEQLVCQFEENEDGLEEFTRVACKVLERAIKQLTVANFSKRRKLK